MQVGAHGGREAVPVELSLPHSVAHGAPQQLLRLAGLVYMPLLLSNTSLCRNKTNASMHVGPPGASTATAQQWRRALSCSAIAYGPCAHPAGARAGHTAPDNPPAASCAATPGRAAGSPLPRASTGAKPSIAAHALSGRKIGRPRDAPPLNDEDAAAPAAHHQSSSLIRRVSKVSMSDQLRGSFSAVLPSRSAFTLAARGLACARRAAPQSTEAGGPHTPHLPPNPAGSCTRTAGSPCGSVRLLTAAGPGRPRPRRQR